MSKLSGKVAVVTGASKGIGAGIAKRFGAEGASVVVNYSTSREGADKVVKEITDAGGKATAIQADLSNSADVERLFNQTKDTFGPVDVLVNNAGVYKFQSVDSVTEDEFHRQFNTNVLGPILAIRESSKHFGPNGGSIINVGSAISRNAFPEAAVYTATKHAVDGLTKSFAKELAPRNIRVNSLNPGGVDTEGSRDLGMIGGEMEKQLVSNTPLGRIGQPEDIAPVAVFLASEDSAWLTGEILVASGGL